MTDAQDLLQQIASAGARMDPGLSDHGLDRLIEGANRRRRRRAARRAVLLGTGVCGVLVLLVGWWQLHRATVITQPIVAAPHQPLSAPGPADDRTLRLSDGSTATPVDAHSEIVVLAQSPTRVGLSLTRGSGRFQVTPRPERALSVRAGDVTVTVIGTVFTVERIADRVGVAVERGTVRVEWSTGSHLLGKGESGWFPPLGTSAQPALKPAGRGTKDVLDSRAAVREVQLPDSTHQAGEIIQGESAEDLLRAADTARLAGNRTQAAEFLRKVLRDHQDDLSAPLAAFTLGRVLLMELGQPREAAAAFAEARRLAPGGALAEDALAREVEAWGKAGQPDLRRARAAEYLRLYPAGRRAAAVRALGTAE